MKKDVTLFLEDILESIQKMKKYAMLETAKKCGIYPKRRGLQSSTNLQTGFR